MPKPHEPNASWDKHAIALYNILFIVFKMYPFKIY